jgi:hypothetical protein
MQIPGELIVDMDKENRSLVITPELDLAMPDLRLAFHEVDDRYLEDPPAYLARMSESVFHIARNGRETACSLIYDSETAEADSLLMMFAPFSDGPPETPPSAILDLSRKEEAGLRDKEHAKPNTWNQATKSVVTHDLLKALGHGMPVISIYSPVPTRFYGKDERKSIRRGDISPVGETAKLAIEHAQDIFHGPYGETRITDIHTHGASLGDNAIGAASVLTREDELRVRSVTAQELILMRGGLFRLADRYMLRKDIGEPSDLEPDLTVGMPRIFEPAVRQDIDKHGVESSTYWRVLKAMSKITYLKALTRPVWLSEQVEYLADEGVGVTVANAVNSRVSYDTDGFLPFGHENLDYTTIVGVHGQKVGHLADEHVALVAGVIALGVGKSLRV